MLFNKGKNNFHFSYTSEQLGDALRLAGIVCIGMLTLFLLVHTMSAIKAYPGVGEDKANGIQNTITVSGQAEMEVFPDLTTFSWTVETEGKTVAESQSKAAIISNKSIAYLKEQGIPEADIKTLSLSTNTKYDTKYGPCNYPTYDMPVSSVSPTSAGAPSRAVMPPSCTSGSVVSGYTTYQSVQVKVRNANKKPELTGQLIAGLANIGAKVSGPENTVDNPDAYKNRVRAEAIAKARAEANVLARSLGVKLVRVTSFSDNDYGYPRPYAVGSSMKAEAYDAVAPALPTGTNTISSNVTITYEIR